MKVSAIISAYYAEEFIEGRLKNLLTQELLPEIVVIAQKGSYELEVAKEFETDFASHGVFKILQTDDIPPIYTAWNMGIKVATGEYLTNANSDDRLYDDALREMAFILDNNPEVGLVFSAVDLRRDQEKEVNYWKRIDDGTGIWHNAFNRLMERCCIGAMPMWRASVHKEIGYYDERYFHASDYEFFLRMAFAGYGFYYIVKALGIYNRRWNSDEWKNKEASVYEHTQILTDYTLKAGVKHEVPHTHDA